VGIFTGRTAKCPKCSAKLEKSGAPCGKCDFGHIELTLEEPEVKLYAADELVPVYITDEIITRINSLKYKIRNIDSEILRFKEIPKNGVLNLTWNKRAYGKDESETKGPIEITRVVLDVAVERLRAERAVLEQQLEDIRSGRIPNETTD
jgi:hypothetical protein